MLLDCEIYDMAQMMGGIVAGKETLVLEFDRILTVAENDPVRSPTDKHWP